MKLKLGDEVQLWLGLAPSLHLRVNASLPIRSSVMIHGTLNGINNIRPDCQNYLAAQLALAYGDRTHEA